MKAGLRAEELLLDVNAAQRKASAPDSSVWVGASAGSGKTKVLADRVTRLLLSGVHPQRILCLTFTRAAAAEMSIRLTQRLSHWATCSVKELDEELDNLEGIQLTSDQRDRARRLFAQVLACPGGMRLITIHGFAQEILRRFPLEAGIAPHFTVMEEADATALWHDVLTDVLQNMSSGKDEETARAFVLLSNMMAEGTLKDRLRELQSQKGRLHFSIEEAGGIENLFHALRHSLGLDKNDTYLNVKRTAVEEGAFNRKTLLHAATCAAEKGGKDDKKRATRILDFLGATSPEERSDLFDDYVRGFFTGKMEPYAKFGVKKLVEEFPELVETYRTETERLTALLEKLAAAQTIEETEAILTFGLKVVEAYAARKKRQAVLDYDDLIEKARALLSRSDMAPWVLYKLDGGIDHMLVDEAQDTSPSQWAIIKAVADEYFSGEGARTDQERTLFVVGDEKQSIYSFLKADPEAFEHMRTYFAHKITEADKAYDEVPLNVSFRSTPAVLKAVDIVFADDVVRKGVSRMPVHHDAFRATGAGRVELWPCVRPPQKEEEKAKRGEALDWALPIGYETADDPAADLADKIARQIKQWVEKGHTVYDRDLKADRPMAYGDVMILIQKRQAFVYHLVRALKKYDVEVSGVDRMFLTKQLAVMDLLALLQFTLLPEDDLTLATVLRGPLIGASEDDLMALAIDRDGTLWQSLKENASYKKWRDYLSHIASLADQMPPLQMLVRILSEGCPADDVSGRRAIASRLGPDAEDPIDELLNAAESFGQRHTPSLQSFIHWLFSTEVQVKREMDQATGCVRIATVHGSKGLEAPVVILPDTFSTPDRNHLDKILWAHDKATGLELPFYIPRTPRHPLLKKLQDTALTRREEEQRRLLYVAMTRAADRLYIGGYENKVVKEKEGAEVSVGKKGTWYATIANSLKEHHQPEAVLDENAILEPQIVLADYASLTTAPAGGAEPASKKDIDLPDWLRRPPAEEPLPPRPLIPSRPSELEQAEEPEALSPQDARFARGRIIHRLLQNLPDVEKPKRTIAASRFVASPIHNLNEAQQKGIVNEVMCLLDDPSFAPLFNAQSRAEQSVVGISDGRLIAGQIDRLAIVDDEVWIVDYKTNRPPPLDPAKIPNIYRKQMESYCTVLATIYKEKKVRCFLLWTYTATIMEL